jgi:hypothetical protein
VRRAHLELGDLELGKHQFDKAEPRMAAWAEEGNTLAYQHHLKYWIVDSLETQVKRRVAQPLVPGKISCYCQTSSVQPTTFHVDPRPLPGA